MIITGLVIANVYTSYYAYPSYSWSVYVVAHELGHMIKSQHTQWCGWLLPNGTNGAIDSYYTSEGGLQYYNSIKQQRNYYELLSYQRCGKL